VGPVRDVGQGEIRLVRCGQGIDSRGGLHPIGTGPLEGADQ